MSLLQNVSIMCRNRHKPGRRRFTRQAVAAGFGLLVLGAGVPGSRAQDIGAPGAYGRVADSCRDDYRAFCSAPVANPDGMAEAFCLKFRKSDLSLGCRHAIDAVSSKVRQPQQAP